VCHFAWKIRGVRHRPFLCRPGSGAAFVFSEMERLQVATCVDLEWYGATRSPMAEAIVTGVCFVGLKAHAFTGTAYSIVKELSAPGGGVNIEIARQPRQEPRLGEADFRGPYGPRQRRATRVKRADSCCRRFHIGRLRKARLLVVRLTLVQMDATCTFPSEDRNRETIVAGASGSQRAAEAADDWRTCRIVSWLRCKACRA